MYYRRRIDVFNRTRRFRRPGWRLLAALFVCIGAIAFYTFIAFASNTKIPTVQPDENSSQTANASSVQSDSGTASSASPVSSESPVSQQAAENRVSLQQAAKPLWVKVSLPDQTVVVYDAENRMVQNFICSTGKDGADATPVGTYTVQLKGKSFFSQQYQEGAYYWTQFKGDFLFHSVPFDKNRNIEQEEAEKLGSKASHGCVRLAIENAKWIYDNIPKGTKVVIA